MGRVPRGSERGIDVLDGRVDAVVARLEPAPRGPVVVEGAFGMTDGGKVAGISDPDDDEADAEPAKADATKKP